MKHPSFPGACCTALLLTVIVGFPPPWTWIPISLVLAVLLGRIDRNLE